MFFVAIVSEEGFGLFTDTVLAEKQIMGKMNPLNVNGSIVIDEEFGWEWLVSVYNSFQVAEIDLFDSSVYNNVEVNQMKYRWQIRKQNLEDGGSLYG